MSTKNPRFQITPDVKTALDLLFARLGDQVHEEQLIDAARPSESPLHELFPWDDKGAAHEYRKQVAASILRSYHIVRFRVVEGVDASRTSVKVPFAVKVRTAPEAEKVWVRTQVALKNDFSREQLIAERIAWVRRGIKQLLVVPELAALHDELSKVIDKYDTKSATPASGTP